MSIFEKEATHSDPIIRISRKNEKLCVMHNGWPYDLSPSPIVKMNLPPNMIGVDEVLKRACSFKNITGDFGLRIESDWYLNCDAKANFTKEMLGGWVYELSGEYVKFEKTPVWACPYLKMLLGSPPKVMYLFVDSFGNSQGTTHAQR